MRTFLVLVAIATGMVGCKDSRSPVAESPAADSPAPESAPTAAANSARVAPDKGIVSTDASDSTVIRGDLNAVDWEPLVGKQVRIEGELVVVDTFDLVRRGQLKVARQRLFIPTQSIDPNDADPDGVSVEGGSNVAQVTAAQKINDKATLTLDDGSDEQNIFPPALVPELGSGIETVRIGSVVSNVSGKLVRTERGLLLVVEQPLEIKLAERPERPSLGDADITVASFNVLNYFTTIDDGANNARGADSDVEFQRQRTKTVAAIRELQADVIGLMEIENTAQAEADLVASLNADHGNDVYEGCGVPAGFSDTLGGADAIRVGLIYRRDRVEPVGDVAMISDPAFAIARTPLLQSFRSVEGGQPFTVIVNHFKSKGGDDEADPENQNKGDGQGAFNAARRKQAAAIAKAIESMSVEGNEPRVLVIGDLNAYRQEDPIDVLRAAGLVDLHASIHDDYSFVYYGQCGSLDHAFASKTLAQDVTGVSTWHINSDEPRFLDYNTEYQPEMLYRPNLWRSSDHDPVLIGIKR
jgi:uncharacterized protein